MIARLLFALLFAQQPDEDAFGGGFDQEIEAAEQDPSGREKAALRKRLAEDKVRSQFLRREESSILAAVQKLDRSLETGKKRGAELLSRKKKLELEIARIDKKLAGANVKLAALRDEIGRRAAAMLRLKKTAITDLVAKTRSTNDARRLRDRLRWVLAFDADLVKQTREASADARQLAADLRGERARIDEAAAALEAEKELILETREERGALLRAIQSERNMIERLAGEIAQAAKKLDSELGVIRGQRPPPAPAAGGFAAQKGRLPWPVTGKVEVPFGKRVDPDTGVVIAHKGIDVRAGLADPVRAVFSGTIVHRGWLEGYGRVVVVEHDGGYYSIYAHLESFGAADGAQVEQGQVIGFVGDSGSLKGAYLYLELREGRRTIDPLLWLAK